MLQLTAIPHPAVPLLYLNEMMSSGVQVNLSRLIVISAAPPARVNSSNVVMSRSLIAKLAKFLPKHFRGPSPYPWKLYRASRREIESHLWGRNASPSEPQVGDDLFSLWRSITTDVPAGIK